jgi:hypothetical protein
MTRVLCNWQPSQLSYETIDIEFRRLLEGHGFTVRDTRILSPVNKPHWNATNWHTDDMDPKDNLAIWSNIHPTEVRELVAKDGDVIVIDSSTEHRGPNVRRWFAWAAIR